MRRQTFLSTDSFKKFLISEESLKKTSSGHGTNLNVLFPFELRIEPNNYEGYGMFNRSGKVIKCEEIHFSFCLLAKKPKNCEVEY